MPTKFGVHDMKIYTQVNGEWCEVANVKEYHIITVIPRKAVQLWKSFKSRRNSRLCRHMRGADK